jgi:DNA-directed RNA polymerase sigma subunit (sigma70/sigma32)
MKRPGQKVRWGAARVIRKSLVAIRDQTEVGRMLGCSQQAVDQTECRAFAKLYDAFETERLVATRELQS